MAINLLSIFLYASCQILDLIMILKFSSKKNLIVKEQQYYLISVLKYYQKFREIN